MKIRFIVEVLSTKTGRALHLRDVNYKGAAPTDEEAELINEDLAIVDEAIASINAARADADRKYDELMKIGKGAADSLRDMVAALEVDYDRLEELRDLRAGHEIPDDAREHAGEMDTKASHKLWAITNVDAGKELADLEAAAGECNSSDDAEQRIQEDALSVEVHSDWYLPGDDASPAEFMILLSTGGPALRIIGELNEHGEPTCARLEVQDWFQPWTDYHEDGLSDVLLAYAGCFYFGEG